jgi:hypothetical protein
MCFVIKKKRKKRKSENQKEEENYIIYKNIYFSIRDKPSASHPPLIPSHPSLSFSTILKIMYKKNIYFC